MNEKEIREEIEKAQFDTPIVLLNCAAVCLEVLGKEKKPLIDKAYSVNCGSDNYKIGYNQCLNEIQQLIKKG